MAKAGDVCVLLQPMEQDIAELRSRQRRLQRLFGGRIHKPVHLTCQRFRPERQGSMRGVIQAVSRELAGVQPFPIMADSLVLVEHAFWQSRLLRWHIQSTVDLEMFVSRLEKVVVLEGIRPHFPSEGGWLPRYVTALEDVQDGDADGLRHAFSSPCRLFDAQRVAFSMIEERKTFGIAGEIRLVGD